ncbi:MAG: lipid-A-disaccharide synthase [Paracoccaceae bacterium]
MSGPRLFLIAGEASGDRLGASLMRALRVEAPDAVFGGVGGEAMRAEGLAPVFDIRALAVMGLTEVLPRLPTILRLLRRATEAALAFRPDALITIDSPSFSLRVAKRVRAAAPGVRTVHYVAPSVWAWRPGRAARMARHVAHVLALLPFEPPYMRAAGMGCDFVGHPIAEAPVATEAEARGFRERHGLGDAPLLLVAPGSRMGELRRLGPLFADVVARRGATRPGLRTVVPVAWTVEDAVEGLFPNALRLGRETGEAERRAAMAAADAALLKSGTITLEAAAAGTPQVAAYRASVLTAAMVRWLIRVDTGNLVNLAVGWEDGARPVPEFYQEAATPAALAGALGPLLDGGPEREAQRAAADLALRRLGRGGPASSTRAARSVLAALG